MKKNKASTWIEFANWLRAETEKRQIPLTSVQPYAGFWSKVGSGRVRTIPTEVIKTVERHFRKSIEELFNEAGVAFASDSDQTTSSAYSAPTLPVLAAEHEIFVAWSDGVPDHMWPYIAFKRGYFSDARIKATMLDAECASDFPEGYAQAMQSCLPKNACGVGTWNEMKETGGWPIAVTHHFIGFAAIGRAPSRIKPLERDSPREFGRLIHELSRRNISHHRIGCVTENSIEFLRLAIELGKECIADMPIRDIPTAQLQVAVERTPHLLEELYELGEWGWDLAVGHALTHALAVQNPNRYQVYFTWEHLRAIAAKIKSPIAAELERLAAPTPFLLNHEPQTEDRALVCRLWSVAFRASHSILGGMTPSAAAELLNELKSLIPYSNPNDVTVTPRVFSEAWHKSYRPLVQTQMFQTIDSSRLPTDRHSSLRRTLDWVSEEKEKAEDLLDKLSKPTSAATKRSVVIAQQFMTLGNFYDARLILEEAARTL